jgi:hypothetical protein
MSATDARPDYAETYADFWREIVENPDGTLNRDQIMRELHDYRVVMHEVALAYDDVTNGRLSKPNTAARHVVAAVDERIDTAVRDAKEEAASELEELFQAMRESGEADMRTAIDHVRRVLRGET